MKGAFVLPLLLIVLLSGCGKGGREHPFVEPGMSRGEVMNIMGTPVRIDSVQHLLAFDLGHMTVDLLDSLRGSLDEADGNRMLMGRPVSTSRVDTALLSWYYGPEVVDTMFTFDSVTSAPPKLEKFWYATTKQRAVTFDVKSGRVTARGFVVLKVAPL